MRLAHLVTAELSSQKHISNGNDQTYLEVVLGLGSEGGPLGNLSNIKTDGFQAGSAELEAASPAHHTLDEAPTV